MYICIAKTHVPASPGVIENKPMQVLLFFLIIHTCLCRSCNLAACSVFLFHALTIVPLLCQSGIPWLDCEYSSALSINVFFHFVCQLLCIFFLEWGQIVYKMAHVLHECRSDVFQIGIFEAYWSFGYDAKLNSQYLYLVSYFSKVDQVAM